MEELQIPELLRNTKSVGCRRIHLRAKSERRMQVKLLSAKLRTLQNQCRTLRQQSQTDRQLLTNLMTATTDLQDKTNQKLQECKVISNELLQSQSQILSTGISQTFQQFNRQYTRTLSEIFLEQNPESIENQQQIVSQFSLGEFQQQREVLSVKQCGDLREVKGEITGIKQSEKQEEVDSMRNLTNNNRSRSDSIDSKLSHGSQFTQANSSTIRFYRKNSSIGGRSKPSIAPKTQNVFKLYIYAVIITIVFTIVLFNLF